MTTTSTSTAAISVAEYSARIGRALRTVGTGVVEGEVQRPKSTPGGMLVFDLTDGTAKLACKVFRTQVAGLQHRPRHGDLVRVCIERPDLWAQAGKLDVIVSDILLAGEGELLRRREELLVRLTREGLCDPRRRRLLPRFPRAVGVVAGKSSDGLRDVVAALQSRFPPVRIVTCEAVVQGARAPLDIIDALAHLDAHPLVDVIVIARGGGSVQDLVAFDDERLCRAVCACDTPVIAAIGHTDNIPVCNHVAWAAETPSRSPELAVPSAASLRQDLELAAAMLAPVPARVGAFVQNVAGIQMDVAGIIRARRADVAEGTSILREAEHTFFAARETGLANAREALAAVPGRIPDIADIAALGGSLDTRAVTFFSQRAHGVRTTAEFTATVKSALVAHSQAVGEAAAGLVAVKAVLAACAHDIALATPTARSFTTDLANRRRETEEQARRLSAGIRKELADHLYDYGRALPRHAGAIRDAARRRLVAEDQLVEDARLRVVEAAFRRIAEAKRSLDHMTELLAAGDPRKRGWVLLMDGAGAVVRSVRALTPGDRVKLSFHDGNAGALIDEVHDQEEP